MMWLYYQYSPLCVWSGDCWYRGGRTRGPSRPVARTAGADIMSAVFHPFWKWVFGAHSTTTWWWKQANRVHSIPTFQGVRFERWAQYFWELWALSRFACARNLRPNFGGGTHSRSQCSQSSQRFKCKTGRAGFVEPSHPRTPEARMTWVVQTPSNARLLATQKDDSFDRSDYRASLNVYISLYICAIGRLGGQGGGDLLLYWPTHPCRSGQSRWHVQHSFV